MMLKFLAWALVAVPEKQEVHPLPEPLAKIEAVTLVESSGLTPSNLFPGRYWSLNDGGHPAALFALDADGKALAPPVTVEGAKNRDWEALEADGEGGLWIGDFGNNLNKRKDLTLYRVDEPGESIPEILKVTKTLRFRYPDQQTFPPEKLNFDCEAMFVRKQQIYLLTKHRADLDTKLYRIKDLQTEEIQTAELLMRFPGIGQVTDASLSADGTRLAVLTFSGIWVFEGPDEQGGFLRGPGRRLKFRNWALRQIEGVAWMDKQTLLICNEQRDLFRISIDGEGWKRFKGRSAESADELP